MLLSSQLLNEFGAYSALRLLVANHEYRQAYNMLEKIEFEISKGFLVWTVDLLNTKLALLLTLCHIDGALAKNLIGTY